MKRVDAEQIYKGKNKHENKDYKKLMKIDFRNFVKEVISNLKIAREKYEEYLLKE